jgi:hypothetical protein
MNFPNINEMLSDMIGARAVVSAHTKLQDSEFYCFLLLLLLLLLLPLR